MISVSHQLVNYLHQLLYHLFLLRQHKVHIVIQHILIVQIILVNVYQKINSVISKKNVAINPMSHHVHKYVLSKDKHYVNGQLIEVKDLHGTMVVAQQQQQTPVQALVNIFIFFVKNIFIYFSLSSLQIIQLIVLLVHTSIWKQVMVSMVIVLV
jgi:hypothetical protein